MSKLNFNNDPFDLDLPYGIKVTVKPLTQPSMLASQAAARKKLNQAYQDEERDDRDGLYQAYLIFELAKQHVTTLIVQDQPAPPSEENLKTIMELYPVGEDFFRKITARQIVVNAAKNGLGVFANGIFSQAEAPNTAADAEN